MTFLCSPLKDDFLAPPPSGGGQKGPRSSEGVVGGQRWRVEGNRFDLQNKKKRDERKREKKIREIGDREEEEIPSSLGSGGRKERRRETLTI